jgi:HAT1-interacting factor 1
MTLQKDKAEGAQGVDLAKAEAAASEVRAEKAEVESEQRLAEEGVLNSENNGNSHDAKEKMKTTSTTFEKDDVLAMDLSQVEKEQKDVKEMLQELKLKLEEYANAAAPGSSTGTSADPSSKASMKETLQQAINEALLGSSTNALGAPPLSNPNAPVNDLSAMVKKKKKVEEPTKENGKRKESTTEESSKTEADSNKKAKVE